MSFDITLEINTGYEFEEIVDVGSPTYNIAPMFTLALGRSIRDLNEMSPREAIPLLEKAIAHMEANPETYSDMNPENGWGDSGGAGDILRKLLAACLAHPACTIFVR